MVHNFKSVKIIGCTYNGTDSHVKHSRLFTSGPQPPDEFEIEWSLAQDSYATPVLRNQYWLRDADRVLSRRAGSELCFVEGGSLKC
eukprot:scaffold201737_cov50-Attheya_sp.AAC.1